MANKIPIDVETIAASINAVASAALLAGYHHGKSGAPVDNHAIRSRVAEAIQFIASEFAANAAEMPDGTK